MTTGFVQFANRSNDCVVRQYSMWTCQGCTMLCVEIKSTTCCKRSDMQIDSLVMPLVVVKAGVTEL